MPELGLERRGLSWREQAGEAAFYGPKIDVQVIDAAGKEESIATVQLDFNQPERFDLSYTGADGSAQRVIMIHRGVIGSMERMTAFLLEAYDGRLPIWLAPVQVCLLPVGDSGRGRRRPGGGIPSSQGDPGQAAAGRQPRPPDPGLPRPP